LPSQWFETFFQGAMVEFWSQIIPPALTLQETDFLQHALELQAGSRVLDVPCGNGRHAVELAKRGCRVTGVDLSVEFLNLARQAAASANVNIDYLHSDMRELPSTGEFDAAYCWGNSFGYMDYAGAEAFLAALARALKPGGRLGLDSCVTAETILPALRPQRWHRTGDLVVLSEAHYSAAESRLDIDYTTIRRDVIETKRASSYVFTAAEQLRMLATAGFDVVSLSGGMTGEKFELNSPRLLIIARVR
jgi:cyclopropane fatty-acyl-phospholipid synthase-like methyltransferase